MTTTSITSYPYHTDVQSEGSSSSQTIFTNFFEGSHQSFQTLQSEGVSSSQTNFNSSSYQMIFISSVTNTTEEDQVQDDSLLITIHIPLEEDQVQDDSVMDYHLVTIEEDQVQDEQTLGLSLTIPLEEDQVQDDSVSTSTIGLSESQVQDDSLLITIHIPLEEDQVQDDSVRNFNVFNLEEDQAQDDQVVYTLSFPGQFSVIDSTVIEIPALFEDNDSSCIQVASIFEIDDSTDIVIRQNTLAGVTSASSTQNPLLPTVAVNGQVLVSNNATFSPNGVGSTNIFVGLQCQGIVPGNNLTDLFNFSVNLTLGGGTFSIKSVNQVGISGTVITLFGLQAFITKQGKFKDNTGQGYITQGIFGSPLMNKQIQLVVYYPQFRGVSNLLPTQFLQTPPSNVWSTVQTAAQALANAVGVSVNWCAPDSPLTDMFPQSGTKVNAALQQLAARVGGILTWDGGTNYEVILPNSPVAQWMDGYCQLLGAGGLSDNDVFDIEDQITLFPISPIGGGGTVLLPPPLNPNNLKPNRYQNLGSISKVLTASDPNRYFDIPGDAQEIYIQILTTTATEGTYVTTTPTVFFPYSNPSSSTDPNIVTVNGVKKVQINSAVFPTSGTNSDVDAGNFSLNVAYISNTDAYNTIYNNSINEETATSQQVINQNLEVLRFTVAEEATLNTAFFGSLPIPGMGITGDIENVVIGGLGTGTPIIESVSLTYPGMLQLNIARYNSLNFTKPRGLLVANG